MERERSKPESHAPERSLQREGRLPVRVICLFLLAYFVTRLSSLGALPIFLDESVHIQWAERLVHEGRVLRPIGAGRVLAVVAYGLALPFEDRLWAARAIASVVGSLTLIFIMLLADRLWGRRGALIAGGLSLLSPFALVYDRLALSDGFLTAALTGMMLAVLVLVHGSSGRWVQFAIVLSIALSVFSKVSALLFLGSLPLAALILPTDRIATLRRLFAPTVIGLAASTPMLWFFYANSGEIREQHIVDPLTSGSVMFSTLRDMSQWLLGYFTLPTLLTAAISFVLLRDRRVLWLAASCAVPFALFALFSQPWSARYVLPTLPPLLVLAAGGIDLVSRLVSPRRAAWTAVGLTLLASMTALPFSWALLTHPEDAPFPHDDRIQLVTGWPAGYGVREMAERIRRESAAGPLEVYVDTGANRTVAAGLTILLHGAHAVERTEGDFGSAEFRARMKPVPGRRALIAAGPRSDQLDFKPLLQGFGLKRLEVYQRPGGEWAGTLFEIQAVSTPASIGDPPEGLRCSRIGVKR
ncbi:MAG: glycosyltransferase family 39 protein [Vicinamibacteria bacterium]